MKGRYIHFYSFSSSRNKQVIPGSYYLESFWIFFRCILVAGYYSCVKLHEESGTPLVFANRLAKGMGVTSGERMSPPSRLMSLKLGNASRF